MGRPGRCGPALNAYPDEISFKVVKDINSAITSLKSGSIDLVPNVPGSIFNELKNSPGMKDSFYFGNPLLPSVVIFGMNNRSPKLNDKKVRLALSHMLNVDEVLESFLSGMGRRTVGPVRPDKPYYNNALTPIPFDLKKANDLLDESGWVDNDGDGVRDKMVNGKKAKTEP